MTWRLHHAVWTDAGRPASVKAAARHDGLCYLCGEPCGDLPAAPAAEALGPGFTDQAMAERPLATHVCTPCCFLDRGEVPPRRTREEER